jgi:hypothetical protein
VSTSSHIHWREWAACRYSDPELFFPEGDAVKVLAQTVAAKIVCAQYPVRESVCSRLLCSRGATRCPRIRFPSADQVSSAVPIGRALVIGSAWR